MIGLGSDKNGQNNQTNSHNKNFNPSSVHAYNISIKAYLSLKSQDWVTKFSTINHKLKDKIIMRKLILTCGNPLLNFKIV